MSYLWRDLFNRDDSNSLLSVAILFTMAQLGFAFFMCILFPMKFVIRFQLLGDDTNFNKFSLLTFQLGEFMRLDAAATRALNLLPNPSEGCKLLMMFYLSSWDCMLFEL